MTPGNEAAAGMPGGLGEPNKQLDGTHASSPSHIFAKRFLSDHCILHQCIKAHLRQRTPRVR